MGVFVARRGAEIADGAEDNRVPVLVGVAAMFVCLCSLAVTFRWVVKRVRKSRFEVDDWLCFAAFVLFLGFAATAFLDAQYGIGRRAVFLQSLPDARDRNINIRNLTLAQQFIHLFTITLVKLSILFLYRRLFTRLITWFNLLWWACVAMTAVYQVIYIFLLPIQGYPCPLTGPGLDCPFPEPAKKFFAPGGAGNASMDLVILLLPIVVVRTLQMSKQNRSALVGVFLLGLAAVVVSFARVPYMQNYYAGPDPTYDQIRPVLFGIAESGTAIICACLPVLRPLLSKETYSSVFSRKKSSYINSEWSVENSNGSLRPGQRQKPSETSSAVTAEDMELSDFGNLNGRL